jgi:hypothetical protein
MRSRRHGNSGRIGSVRASGTSISMALMPSTSLAVDFVPEGGRGTMGSMSRSRLRTFAIEIWHRFDLDNFQALIDRRNSSTRKLIMYLKRELQSRLVWGLE